MTTRRGMLKLLAAVPAAVPIAAKEAAAKMGLGSVVASGHLENQFVGAVPSAMSTASYRDQLVKLLSAEQRTEIRSDIAGRPLLLDPDLAALRTVSPSVARSIQMEREIDRRIRRERSWLESQIKKMTGGLL